MLEGTLIAGKYRLVSLLGQGGMGSVWRAQHLDLDAPVAIKLLDPSIAANPEGLTRFHREAQAAAALRSPHVVQIFDRGVDEATHQPFIVMELMEGESLASRIGRLGLLSPEQTARIVTQVSRALSRAHDAGIVHRDLKPDNIFLVQNEDEEVAKVLDFGIAKSDKHRLDSGSHTRTGAVMGTPYYMSPEQISGSKGVDARTDIWALGVIACECLTGRRPFDAETIGGLAVKICAEAPPTPSRLGPVSPAFDAWFAKAVARESTARFQTAREAAEELRRACGIEAGTPGLSASATGQHAHLGPSTNANTNAGLARSAADAVTAGPQKTSLPVGALLGGLAALAVVAGAGAWFAFGRTPSVAPDAPSAVAVPPAPSATATTKTPEVAPNVTAGPAATAEASPSATAVPSATASAVPPSVAKPAVAARPAAKRSPATGAKPTSGSKPSDIGSAIDQRR